VLYQLSYQAICHDLGAGRFVTLQYTQRR